MGAYRAYVKRELWTFLGILKLLSYLVRHGAPGTFLQINAPLSNKRRAVLLGFVNFGQDEMYIRGLMSPRVGFQTRHFSIANAPFGKVDPGQRCIELAL